MPVQKTHTLTLAGEADIVHARQQVRKWATELEFSLVDQTKLVTAASEIARNTVIYGKGGILELQAIVEGARRCLRMIFQDNGPGIPDIEQALRDGFTSGGGLGLGLGGAKRLVNEFDIQSEPGKGTRITLARWR